MSRKKALSKAEQAQQIAEQKLIGSGYVLRRGNPYHDVRGWRFPVRLVNDPDTSADDEPVVVTVLVQPHELPAD